MAHPQKSDDTLQTSFPPVMWVPGIKVSLSSLGTDVVLNHLCSLFLDVTTFKIYYRFLPKGHLIPTCGLSFGFSELGWLTPKTIAILDFRF